MSIANDRYLAALELKSKAAKPLISFTDFKTEVLKATSKTGVSVHSIQRGCGAGESLKHIMRQNSFATSQHNVLLILAELGYRLCKVKKINRSKFNRRRR